MQWDILTTGEAVPHLPGNAGVVHTVMDVMRGDLVYVCQHVGYSSGDVEIKPGMVKTCGKINSSVTDVNYGGNLQTDKVVLFPQTTPDRFVRLHAEWMAKTSWEWSIASMQDVIRDRQAALGKLQASPFKVLSR